MRCDQYIGLTSEGEKFVEENALQLGVKKITEEYTSGEVKILSTIPIYEKKVYDEHEGFGFHPLYEYTAKDGSVFREAVQANPWSSGPVIFVALKDENGEWIEETLWNENDIQEMI